MVVILKISFYCLLPFISTILDIQCIGITAVTLPGMISGHILYCFVSLSSYLCPPCLLPLNEDHKNSLICFFVFWLSISDAVYSKNVLYIIL